MESSGFSFIEEFTSWISEFVSRLEDLFSGKILKIIMFFYVFLMYTVFVVRLDFAVKSVDAQISAERESDGAFHIGRSVGSKNPSHFDHEAIIGSAKEAEEYDHLSPEESKRRLLLLLQKADTKNDGYIDKAELLAWIKRSFEMLNKEESDERFSDADENQDGKVTWAEYVGSSLGSSEEDDAEGDKMLEIEKVLFRAADKDKDKALDRDEFLVFTVPEEHPIMHPHLVAQTLQDKDKDGDGFINFEEFVDRKEGESADKEWLIVQEEKFREEYDTDKDGKLNSQEILNWIIPNNDEVANEEVNHLFASADDDQNDLLSFTEILEHHDIFVGSEVTDYGDHLHNMHLFDEL